MARFQIFVEQPREIINAPDMTSARQQAVRLYPDRSVRLESVANLEAAATEKRRTLPERFERQR